MHRYVLAAIAALALTVATDATAQARGGRGNPGNMITGWFVLDPGSPAGVGVGGRVLIPLVPEGFMSHVLRNGMREEFDLELGLDYVHWGYDYTYWDPAYGYRNTGYGVNSLNILGGVLWNWWLTPKFSVYPKIDVGYEYAWLTGWPDSPYVGSKPSYSTVFVNGAVGLMYRVGNQFTFRLETGTHALTIGAALDI
jgi:hypothetical protein